jgi:hypothetical protein
VKNIRQGCNIDDDNSVTRYLPAKSTEFEAGAGGSAKDVRPADLDDVDRRILSSRLFPVAVQPDHGKIYVSDHLTNSQDATSLDG